MLNLKKKSIKFFLDSTILIDIISSRRNCSVEMWKVINKNSFTAVVSDLVLSEVLNQYKKAARENRKHFFDEEYSLKEHEKRQIINNIDYIIKTPQIRSVSIYEIIRRKYDEFIDIYDNTKNCFGPRDTIHLSIAKALKLNHLLTTDFQWFIRSKNNDGKQVIVVHPQELLDYNNLSSACNNSCKEYIKCPYRKWKESSKPLGK